MRSVEQSTRFAKAKRRLPPRGQLTLDEEVKRLVENPLPFFVPPTVITVTSLNVSLLFAWVLLYARAKDEGNFAPKNRGE